MLLGVYMEAVFPPPLLLLLPISPCVCALLQSFSLGDSVTGSPAKSEPRPKSSPPVTSPQLQSIIHIHTTALAENRREGEREKERKKEKERESERGKKRAEEGVLEIMGIPVRKWGRQRFG